LFIGVYAYVINGIEIDILSLSAASPAAASLRFLTLYVLLTQINAMLDIIVSEVFLHTLNGTFSYIILRVMVSIRIGSWGDLRLP
jgi:hypothetical protein